MLGTNYEQPELFREEQHFSGVWLRLLLFSISGGLIVLFGWGFYQQIIQHQPWGNMPVSDAGLIFLTVMVYLLAFALPFLFLKARLVVTVDSRAVHISFFPFMRRTVPLTEITGVQARKSKPLLEFGGAGVRWMPKGWAYLVSGDRVVQLDLISGKSIFVGSQRAEELASATITAKSTR
jgi:hypothetical protein